MLLLLLAGIYAALIPIGWGIWTVRLLRTSLRLTDELPQEPLLTWLAGIMLLTVLLEMVSLVGPIHTAAHAGVLVVGVAGLVQPGCRHLLWSLQVVRQWHWPPRVLAGLLLCYVLLIGTMPSSNYDTGLYHAQSVRWLEEMGILPGLTNANIHIGFNSAWFVPEALFSWGRYLGTPLQVLNGVFFVLFGWYCLAGLDRVLRGQTRPTDVVRLVLLLLMFQMSSDIASLSPDLPVALLLFYIVLQVLELPPARPGLALSTPQVVVLALCLFALTIKLSTLPILLLAVWWLGRSGRLLQGRWLLVLGTVSLVMVGPWLARNIILSGYLVFPLSLNLFHPSWQFPLTELRLQSDYIKEFARDKHAYRSLTVLHAPLRHWVPIWWQQQQLLDNKVVLLGILGLLLADLPLAWWQRRRKWPLVASQLVVALGIILAGVAFWFVMAPSPRFGYGFLSPMLALLSLPYMWLLVTKYPRGMARGFGLAIIVIMVVSPLQMHLSRYYIPQMLSRAEYDSLLRRVASPARQAMVRTYFSQVGPDSVRAPIESRGLAWRRLVMVVSRVGGIPGRSGLDGTGRSGLFGLGDRLIMPAPYPIIAVQPLHLGAVQVLQSVRDERPWYAPFPFVSRRQLCQANGPQLRDGFRARILPNIRNWSEVGVW